MKSRLASTSVPPLFDDVAAMPSRPIALPDRTRHTGPLDRFSGPWISGAQIGSSVDAIAGTHLPAPGTLPSTADAIRPTKAVPGFAEDVDAVKRLFDHYFRDDLYGHYASRSPLILSSGSFDESVFGMPEILKSCVRYSLSRNWYGYSDSLGIDVTREALARLETARRPLSREVSAREVAVTLGATSTVSILAEFLARSDERQRSSAAKALCATPNYPPLVASIGQRFQVQTSDLELRDDGVDISAFITHAKELRPELVLIQSVINPWGRRIAEEQLGQLIDAVAGHGTIIVDDCHDIFPRVNREALTPRRRDPHVIEVHSLSKRWASPGIKTGWIVASEQFLDDFYGYASTSYGSPPSISYLLMEMFATLERRLYETEHAWQTHWSTEYGLTPTLLDRAFDEYQAADREMAMRVERGHRISESILDGSGIAMLPAEYSINFCALLGDDGTYATYRRIIDEANVSVFPGVLTFLEKPGLIRISPCVDERDLVEGLTAIVDSVARRGASR